MTLDEINKELKLLNAKKIKIEKLMKKANGDILNQAWISNESDINDLSELINNCDFTVN